ncbi:hypothetical protein [Dishui Lake phycodnavirus 2]|nr:hypothetical protein [Dishui Lake phycodnavirus 2]
MATTSLWDILPTELQEIILQKSIELCREDYLKAGIAKHNRAKKKQGRGLLTADMIRYIQSGTDPMELINWAFELEVRELEMLVDPPVHLLNRVYDYDYSEYYDEFLTRAAAYLEDPTHKDEWIVPSDDCWLTMFTKLNDFHRKNGHLHTLDDDPKLYLWLEQQKDADTHLSRERRHSLQTLGVRLPPFRRANI